MQFWCRFCFLLHPTQMLDLAKIKSYMGKKKWHMSTCEWFEVMWIHENLTWKFNFSTQVPNQTFTYSK